MSGRRLLIQARLQRRLSERSENAEGIQQLHQQREPSRFRARQHAQNQRRRGERADRDCSGSGHRAGREESAPSQVRVFL